MAVTHIYLRNNVTILLEDFEHICTFEIKQKYLHLIKLNNVLIKAITTDYGIHYSDIDYTNVKIKLLRSALKYMRCNKYLMKHNKYSIRQFKTRMLCFEIGYKKQLIDNYRNEILK